MKFLSLEPFVPSGSNFEASRDFFTELGFHINWQVDGYIGFQRDECRFILQRFDNVDFAQNFMLSVKVSNAEEFRTLVLDKKLPEKYGIRIGEISKQPYGVEVNIIDIAGVCWHFVEQ
jgi:catechol 2,3-dioxygenase-like lactoylglutathione lyase family enzyme